LQAAAKHRVEIAGRIRHSRPGEIEKVGQHAGKALDFLQDEFRKTFLFAEMAKTFLRISAAPLMMPEDS
jgi:hypothetical protein